jgi:hypothetical protein
MQSFRMWLSGLGTERAASVNVNIINRTRETYNGSNPRYTCYARCQRLCLRQRLANHKHFSRLTFVNWQCRYCVLAIHMEVEFPSPFCVCMLRRDQLLKRGEITIQLTDQDRYLKLASLHVPGSKMQERKENRTYDP